MSSLMSPSLKALPSVEQLSSRVWRVLGLNPGKFTLQGTNTYLVGTGESRILIDTGEADKPDYLDLLKDTLSRLNTRISQVLITHWHHDHLGGALGVASISPGAVFYKLPMPASGSQWYPLRSPEVGLEGDPSQQQLYSDLLTEAADHQVFSTEGATLKVLHTPGHTADHMALLLEEEGAIFTGDCVLGQGSAVFEELGIYMKSLARLRDLSPKSLYPGHGPVVEEGAAKITQYIEHRMAREKQVIEELEKHLDKGISVMDIVKVMYKDVAQSLWMGAASNVTLHLYKLLSEGRVSKFEQDGDTLWRLTLTKL